MRVFSLYFFFSIIIISCTVPYSERLPDSALTHRDDFEIGKCYSAIKPVQRFQSHQESYFIFTGDPRKEKVKVDEITIQIKPRYNHWIKTKTDPNCVSSDPDACLVWCLKEIQAEYIDLMVLNDTSQSENFVIEYIDIYEPIPNLLIEEEIYIEVVCSIDLTRSLIREIQSSLYELGYDLEITSVLDLQTKKNLYQFQNSENLSQVIISTETLEALFITY